MPMSSIFGFLRLPFVLRRLRPQNDVVRLLSPDRLLTRALLPRPYKVLPRHCETYVNPRTTEKLKRLRFHSRETISTSRIVRIAICPPEFLKNTLCISGEGSNVQPIDPHVCGAAVSTCAGTIKTDVKKISKKLKKKSYS